MINLTEARYILDVIASKIDFEHIFDEYGISAESFIYATRNLNRDKFSIYHGATKGVIIPRDSDFVFKIGFNARVEDYPDTLTYEYCYIEKEIYEKAKKHGVSSFFAACAYFDTINEIDIFIQQKVVPAIDHGMGSIIETELYDRIISASSSYDALEYIPFEWIEDFINYYSEEEFYKLCEFLDDYGVNDLHEGNIGYLNNAPIIFDYAGWYD